MFGVTILGNNSALPAHNRHPTAQVITMSNQLFLVDCGEGTQMQMNVFKIRRSRINHIFISHLHGDHYFGLPGIITSYGLLGRIQELHLYAPPPLQDILNLQFSISDTKLPFQLNFHALKEETIILNEERFLVECFKVFHRIECWGFLFREKRAPRKINAESVRIYDVPYTYYDQLKQGMDYTLKNGEIILNEALTHPNKSLKSYAFCSDTIYTEALAEKVKNVNLLYHEATYLKDKEEKAMNRFHSTTVQAASLAKLANVNKLIIGHFSSNYNALDEFLTEAQEIFANTQLALEGQTYLVE